MGRISSSDNKEQWRKSQKRHTGLIHAYGTADRYGAEKQGAEPDEKGHGREQRCQRMWLLTSGLLFFCFLWASMSYVVSACAAVTVRMTSDMPSVFVSEATGGAGGVPGGEQW